MNEDKTWTCFYRAFEDRFRGSKNHIQQTLTQRYQRLLAGISQINLNPIAYDLGCGRGEMCELLAGLGFKVTGIDQSANMLEPSPLYERVVMDLLEFLKKTPDNSTHLISMIHVIEHCPPPYIFEVMKEVHRCLTPKGACLLETPSAFSLWACVRQFYLDPTHDRPVHPEYLTFMAQYLGFSYHQELSFAPVEHPERAQLSRHHIGETRSEFLKLEQWLYGPADGALWLVK